MLSKIDEILVWEKSSDHERDTQFVELGRYLCEVRASRCSRIESVTVVGSISGEEVARIAAQGLLLDGDSRTPATCSEI